MLFFFLKLRHEIQLSPFSIDDFEATLCSSETSNLLTQVQISLLKSIKNRKDIKEKNWEEILAKHCKSKKIISGEVIEQLESEGYPTLDVDDKLQILKFLCNQVLNSEDVRAELEECSDLASKKDNENESIKRKLTRAIRVKPLGQDRDGSYYWYFPNNRGRLYVENHSKTQTSNWTYHDKKSDWDELLQSLDRRGIREFTLAKNLEKVKDTAAREIRSIVVDENIYVMSTRRSTRNSEKSAEKASFQSYINKFE